MSAKIYKGGQWVSAEQGAEQVTPGATAEQVAQIAANTAGIQAMQAVGAKLEKKNTEQDAGIQANTDHIADVQAKMETGVVSGTLDVGENTYTVTLELDDGSTETHVLETDENNYPVKLTVNGAEIPWTVTGVS